MKKSIITIMLGLIFIVSSFMSITAFATSNSQDGLVATLTTDKESYDIDEEISITLTVENTNVVDIENITTEIILPTGLSVSSGTALQDSFTLSAGESIVNTVVAVVTDATMATPDTGDSTNLIIWLILAVFSLCGLIFIGIRNKSIKNKNLLAMIFVLAIFMVTPVIEASATSDVKQGSFTLSESITIDGEENLVQAKISYDNVGFEENDNTVTVSFNTGDGEEVADIIIEKGSTLDNYPSTTLDGYNFNLWYTEPTLTNLFDYTAPINEDMVLYASFTEIASDELVTYDATELYLADQDADFSFTVYSEEKITSSNLSSYVSMENTLGATPTYNVSANGNYYTITADGGYTEGSLYTATFATGVTLVSPEVDGYNLSAITKLSFRIYKAEIVEYTLNSDLVEINYSDLISVNEVDYYATISKDLFNSSSIEVGTVIYFEDGENSYYVKVTDVFESGETDDFVTFYFIDAELEDVYDYVDIYFTEMEMQVAYAAQEEEIAQMVYDSEGVEQLTLLLAAAILESDTVETMGDGTDVVDIEYDIDANDIYEMLSNSSNASTISEMATTSTNTSISGTMFADNAELEAAYELALKLMEDLEVNVSMGTAENSNFDIDSTIYGDGFATEWVGVNITLAYETDLGNNVKLSIAVDFSQYLNVTVDGVVSDQYWSWDDFNYYVDFDYAANVYSQTDLNFTILVCSANNEEEEETDPNAEPTDEELWGEAWTNITDEVSGIIEDDEDSDTLVAQMMAMLEESGDYITLIDEPIFTFSANAYVVDINIDVNFVVEVAFAAGISADFSYLSAQQYGMYTKDVNDVKYICYYNNSLEGDGRYVFELSVCGYLGVKAGVALEIGISLPALKTFGNVGLGVEVGLYADLYAYARYIVTKTETDGDVYKSLDGAIYFETGIYLEIYLFAESEIFNAEADWTVYDNKWPLLTAGTEWIYLGLNAELNSQIAEDTTLIITGDFISYEDVLPTFYGNYMSIKTGEIQSQAITSDYTYAKNSSTPYIEDGIYFYSYDPQVYESGLSFNFSTSSTYYRYGEYYSDHEVDYDYYSSIFGDYDIYSDGDMYFTGTIDIYSNYYESTNFLQSGELMIGEMDFIWVSEDYDGSFEGLGESYTATFELEVEDGENIVLTEKTVYSGKTVGSIDPYLYASDELKQEYALMSYTPSVSWVEELVTYTCYEWNVDPTDYVITDSDVTFTLSAPKRETQVAYVFYDETTATWGYEVQTLENGESPTFDTSDGKYISLDTLSVYDLTTASTQIVTDTDNLPAVSIENDITWAEFTYMINDAEDYKGSGYSSQTAAFNAAQSASLAYGENNSYSYNLFDAIYVADYEFDTYTVTYVTDLENVTEEVVCYSSPTEANAFNNWIYYLAFEGWSTTDDGTVDYTRGELPITNEDVTYYGVYSTDYTYTIAITDADGDFTEYPSFYEADVDEDVYDYFQSNLPAQGVSADGSTYSEDYWYFIFAGNITTNNYTDYDDIKDRLETIQETYYKWSDSYFEFEYVESTFYRMVLDPGEGTFDSTALETLLSDTYFENEYYYRNAEILTNDDGKEYLSVYVTDSWYMTPNYLLAVSALVEPTISDEDKLSYYYELTGWKDQNGVEYSFSDTIPADEELTLTPVYEKVEYEYTVNVYNKTDSTVETSVVDTFTGNYTDYEEFVAKYTTDYDDIDRDTAQYAYTYVDCSTTTTDGDIVTKIYLNWTSTLQQYTVTYTNIDEVINGDFDVNVLYGYTTTAKTPSDVDHYDEDEETVLYTSEFLGWDSDGDEKVDYESGETITVYGDMTLEAVWQDTCTIEFVDAFSATHTSYYGVVGDKLDLSELTDPTPAENRVFVGWDWNGDGEFSEEDTAPTTYTTNMTISGVYEYVDRTVTVELTVDGILTEYDVTVKHNDTLSEAMDAFAEDYTIDIEGKSWSGWSATDGDTSGYLTNETIANIAITSDDWVVSGTITAVYVYYYIGDDLYDRVEVAIGEEVTIPDKLETCYDWTVSGATVSDNKFEMPETDVTVTAQPYLDGTFSISDGTNTDTYDANTFIAGQETQTVENYEFDTENGILWINTDDLILSGEAVDISIIVGYDVTTLTLQDLEVLNITTRTNEIEDFVWMSGELIDVDPINAFVLYSYGLELNLTIDGDVKLTQENSVNDGDQNAILYSPLKWGTYEYLDESLLNDDNSNWDDCYVEVEGWVVAQGTFTMSGINDASVTIKNSYSAIETTGKTVISNIVFDISVSFNGIRVYSSYNSEDYTSYEDGTLDMTNCTVSGETASAGGNYLIIAYNDITFTDCDVDDVKDSIYIDGGDGQIYYHSTDIS